MSDSVGPRKRLLIAVEVIVTLPPAQATQQAQSQEIGHVVKEGEAW